MNQTMRLLFLMVGFVVVSSQNAPNAPVVIRRIGCGTMCTHSRFAPAKIEDCTEDQVLMPADHDCYCSDSCVRKEPSDVVCDPKDCELVDCNPKLTVRYCLEQKKAFAKRDGNCLCCDTCITPIDKTVDKPVCF